jgi:hypothetical protein
MSKPYIHLLTRKNYIVFKDNKVEFKNKDYHRDDIFNLVYKQDWIILILEMDCFNIDEVVKFLLSNNIKKVVFIINDVFRITHKTQFIPSLNSNFIETELNNIIFNEIEIIKNIIKQANILEYKIYHCEKVSKNIQNLIKLEINYYDLHLYQWISYQRRKLNILHHNNFNYKVSSFNRRYEEYRTMLTALFHDHDDFYYTMCQKEPKERFFSNNHFSFDYFDNKFKNYLIKKCDKLYKKSLVVLKDAQDDDLCLYNTIQNSFLHLINETRFCSPMQNVSEKSIRPIIAKRPFILAGAPGSLELLKSLGFKTFDQWWCEDYDKEKDHHKRLVMIYHLVNDILNKDNDELKEILCQMQFVLEYNYQVYLNFKTKIYQTI